MVGAVTHDVFSLDSLAGFKPHSYRVFPIKEDLADWTVQSHLSSHFTEAFT
jgi:hypothetical protein